MLLADNKMKKLSVALIRAKGGWRGSSPPKIAREVANIERRIAQRRAQLKRRIR